MGGGRLMVLDDLEVARGMGMDREARFIVLEVEHC